ncbi:MAG: hypothetical protein CO117_10340 [Flavobacteriaceae bacterium CG_4_9_14_3_um_filter_33_16]|nr:MAG: hypothetical protein CO117_10340 [Flavobacteriaceae bacterium CG_4_9_14_3_um_filter_33_16]
MENDIVVGKNYIQTAHNIYLFKAMLKDLLSVAYNQSGLNSQIYHVIGYFGYPITNDSKELYIKICDSEDSAIVYSTCFVDAVDKLLSE